MTWVTWRQQRAETLIAIAVLLALAALLIPTGIEMASTYHRDGLSSCVGQHAPPGCASALQAFTSRFGPLGNIAAWFTLFPGLLGALLAAPFVLDLENGTFRLLCTQSVTRGRWLANKLGFTIGIALLLSLLLTVLATWWRAPLVHLEGRMDNTAFDSVGTVVFGYTLFALGIALAVGVVWRRTVPALMIAFAGYVAARIFFDTWLRQKFQAPLSATWRASLATGEQTHGGGTPQALNHAWVLSQYPSDKLGHPLARPCVGFAATGVRSVGEKCGERGAEYVHAVFQPASRFWTFQALETALFGVTAALLIVFTVGWTQRRVA